ncbi:RNA methyltransferase [Psychrobacter sp. HD31]|uniref:TrmH family RNA methyltransferase n=1 Tax=Psychrobacter sp. HD31 TaxID=3112003 RepID=UPI003DA4B621
MNLTPIASGKNPTIKLIRALLSSNRQRNKHGKTVIEGTHLLDSAIAINYPIEQVFLSQSAMQSNEVTSLLERLENSNTQINIQVVNDKLYQDIRTLGTGIDIMAVLPIKQKSLDTINTDCLILNDVQDSGNVGTLLRTAAAIGIQHIICTAGTAGVWSPKTLRAGMGAQFSLAIYENIEIDQIVLHVNAQMMATSSHTNKLIYSQDLSNPVAWIMGHEGQGVCPELLKLATPIALPQPNGQESLNVAVAGSLCMYETLRQRSYS